MTDQAPAPDMLSLDKTAKDSARNAYTQAQYAQPRAVGVPKASSAPKSPSQPTVNPFASLKASDGQARRMATTPREHDKPFHNQYCSVGAAWRVSLGCVEGWKLYRPEGGPADVVTFDHPDAVKLECVLDFWRPANQYDQQKRALVIFWHKVGKALDVARIVAVLDLPHDLDYWPQFDCNDYPKEVEMTPGTTTTDDAPARNAVERERARRQAATKPTAARPNDFDTFDQSTSPDEPQPAKKELTPRSLDPKQAAFHIPGHLAKRYVQSGKVMRSILDGLEAKDLDAALTRENGILSVWREVDDYERANRYDKPGAPDWPYADAPETPATASNDAPGHTDSADATATKIQRQSEAKTTTKTTIDDNGVIDLKSQIRERYNKPQRGNDYLTVPGRVLLFRLDHPDWTIETEHVLLTETAAVFRAVIRNMEGRVIATGHGKATEAGTKNLGGRYIEKAETAAIGRALALAGFGTDDSLDDSEYLSDSPVEKVAS